MGFLFCNSGANSWCKGLLVTSHLGSGNAQKITKKTVTKCTEKFTKTVTTDMVSCSSLVDKGLFRGGNRGILVIKPCKMGEL